jgi:hypothetical protein
MNIPQRIQASRQHPEPESCFRVTRNSRFGNKHKITKGSIGWMVDTGLTLRLCHSKDEAHTVAVELHMDDLKKMQKHEAEKFAEYLDILSQYEYLSCFCPLNLPCHVDNWLHFLQQRAQALAQQA